ncbi:MAG TPA: DUF6458 family protein [Acidimicrobiia bacterium]
MGTGVSIILIAAGAILTFAVDTRAEGVDLDAMGVILMLVGILGLLFTLVLWDDWRPAIRRRDYVDDNVIVREDPLVVEEGPVVRRRITRRAYH